MKANAPEKIYITPNIDRKWQLEAIDNESVEYTRTDTLVKKAVNFLNSSLSGIVAIKDGNITQGLLRTKSEFIDEFKRYMAGE